jgi:hypothetical protein
MGGLFWRKIMATKKKIVNEYNPDPTPAAEAEYIPTLMPGVVSYEDLVTAKVQVQDKAGNQFYLDPARKQGEFVLRVIPQPVTETPAELPEEWRKPTKEEELAASGKIDWDVPVYETEAGKDV